jgi:phage shock protein PspC (stress-responsive transcriptional regulator)
MQRIYRSRKQRVLAGVCGGIGKGAAGDPSLVRLGWVLLTLLSLGAGIILYIAAGLIIPEEDQDAGAKPPDGSPPKGPQAVPDAGMPLPLQSHR